MGATWKVVKDNHKVWDELRRKLKKAGKAGAVVKVGVLASAGAHDGDISMVELAAIHEFGSPAAGIPERSFIRSTFRNNRELLAKFLLRTAKAVLSDKLSVEDALGQLGLWAVSQIKRTITAHDIPPPLKASTVARKGSTKPLVDTGQLVNSISWEVDSGSH